MKINNWQSFRRIKNISTIIKIKLYIILKEKKWNHKIQQMYKELVEEVSYKVI